MNFFQRLGQRTMDTLAAWGHGAVFFVELMLAIPASLRRFGLVARFTPLATVRWSSFWPPASL